MASRLSYFLWASMPDEELMKLADDGKLHDPGNLERSGSARMLRSRIDRRGLRRAAKVRGFAASFVEQWLGTRALGREFKPDPQRCPRLQLGIGRWAKVRTDLLFRGHTLGQPFSAQFHRFRLHLRKPRASAALSDSGRVSRTTQESRLGASTSPRRAIGNGGRPGRIIASLSDQSRAAGQVDPGNHLRYATSSTTAQCSAT